MPGRHWEAGTPSGLFQNKQYTYYRLWISTKSCYYGEWKQRSWHEQTKSTFFSCFSSSIQSTQLWHTKRTLSQIGMMICFHSHLLKLKGRRNRGTRGGGGGCSPIFENRPLTFIIYHTAIFENMVMYPQY